MAVTVKTDTITTVTMTQFSIIECGIFSYTVAAPVVGNVVTSKGQT